jgi:hypothetical protein
MEVLERLVKRMPEYGACLNGDSDNNDSGL